MLGSTGSRRRTASKARHTRAPYRRKVVRAALCALAFAIAGLAVEAQVPGPNVNMVSGTTLPDGDPFLQRQNEPSGAVSTRNPLHLLGGANDYRTVDLPGLPDDKHTGDAWLGIFKSYDGGQTWRSTLLPGYPQDGSAQGVTSPLKGYDAGADPIVRSANNGLFYYSGIVFDRGTNAPSAVFVSRFIDNNNAPAAGDPIVFLDTKVVATGMKRSTSGKPGFVDKPFMVVDMPRAGAKSCSITAPGTKAKQSIPAGTVYLAYMLFEGDPAAPTSRLMVTRSLDCGVTWSKPSTASTHKHTNQGVSMSIDPTTGALYLAWREFADTSTGDAVVFTKSIDLGRGLPDHADPKDQAKDPEPIKFAAPTTVALIKPFDQGDSGTTFRTNSYPTIAVDGGGRIYLAWSERGWGPDLASQYGALAPLTTVNRPPGGAKPPPPPPTPVVTPPAPGDARVVLLVGTPSGKNTKGADDDDRKVISWGDRRPIDNQPGGGHQIMPVASIVGGRLTIVYNDLREDQSRVFDTFIDELNIFKVSPAKRHTMDVRVAQAVPGIIPLFAPSVRVSQYLMGSRPGSRTIEQLQFNVPNLPLFAQGSTPFVGDYLDITGQTMLFDPGSKKWTFNTSTNGPGVLYAFWTDNRDVRPPADGDWKHYTPPNSPLTAQGCTPGQTGMRNANVYCARISPGPAGRLAEQLEAAELGRPELRRVRAKQHRRDAPVSVHDRESAAGRAGVVPAVLASRAAAHLARCDRAARGRPRRARCMSRRRIPRRASR